MAEVDSKPSNEGPGKLLREAREKKGISHEELSKRLNLGEATIRQLEKDEYASDIPDAFVRGYLRTFAKVVELNEDDILARYVAVTGRESLTYHYQPSADAPPARAEMPTQYNWLLIISVVIVLVLGAFAYFKFIKPMTDAEEESGTATSLPIDSTAGSIPSIQSQNSQNPQTQTPDRNLQEPALQPESSVTNQTAEGPDELTPNTSIDISASVDESETETPVTNTQTELPSGFVDTSMISEVDVSLNFLDDCWVSLTDANGEVMAVGLKTAGRRFTVSGIPPINVVLGKPRAVQMTYDNAEVDLSPYPAGQTARLTLGETVTGN